VIDVELGAIRGRLKNRHAARYAGEARKRAAVAAVLRPVVDPSGELKPLETEVLLIRRADRVGDPWSGQMAFPGGHQDSRDPDLLATAIRETAEEVGLDLRQHELLAALDEHAATLAGGFTGMVIAPFVFALASEPVLQPNHEVASIVWAPLGKMARGELDTQHELFRNGETMRFPAYGVGPHVVWGLTHRMLQNLFASLTESQAHG
jgi:8-oxo-dGTP pyrophosphatase MutT (NUDIX family)